MSREKINLLIDSLMLLSLVMLAVTGFLISPIPFRFGLTFRGPGIVQLHDISSLVFVVLATIHLLLHLDWFKKVIFKKKK